ncbi:hypothetical protein JTE90_018785 [Oedothorax gibbosus]|uniref:Chitinase n=1 Tax=Oedothorax gibbosus TaxID=931172 RepID=A0AAV6UB89_9ARAC|nr:hypothetical protein JTE90_018785 [Oedothorax gibbosus]
MDVKFILLILCVWTSIINAAKSSDNDYKLVCYYANWSIYRPGYAKFTPENINPFLCTHIIYAFAGMNKNYEFKPFDSYNDIQLGNYEKFINLKTYNPKLKAMIAIGGWNEGSKRFSKLVESKSSRDRFVRSALSFLRKHKFDGLDLDWEYPGSRDGAQEDDKTGYAALVQELREAFDSENVPSGRSKLLLTMAVPAGQQYIDKGYDVPSLSKNLDFFNMLTYDYHVGTEATTNHHAPLREMAGLEDWSPDRLLNIEWTVKYYIKKGADPKKLVVGIPTYGRSFQLSDPDETDIGAPAEGPGEKGEYTREAGYLAYYEVCQMIQENDWELEAPYPEIMGPFAYKDNQWVGFDDEDTIIEKVKFIVKEGLGGGMVWTLDNDDFRGKCYGEQSPLINTLKTALEEGQALLKANPTTTTTMAPKRTTARSNRRSQQFTKAPTKAPKLTTPPTFTTPEPPQSFECEDEGFFNNPSDCKKYFWCLDSGPSNLGLVAHSFTCPSGLFFNKARDSCDYAANVVCRVKKVTTTTTTTKPRPRPRTKKTTVVPATTTTRKTPKRKEVTKEIPNDLDALKESALNGDSQSLKDLLQLLQQLGVNQIQDKLHGRESMEATSTINPTLPQYRTPNRRTKAAVETTTNGDIFNQYAKPDRSGKDDDGNEDSSSGAVRHRGPQYHNSESQNDKEDIPDEGGRPSPTSSSEGESKNGFDFPFVYHTPSRHRTQSTPDEVEEVLEDYDDPTTTTPKPKPSPANRRVVVKVRPVPGEGTRSNPPGTLLISTNEDQNRRNKYAISQTVGVRKVARPNVLEEQTTRELPTPKPSTRRARPVTRPPSVRTTQQERYKPPPVPKELMVLQTGRPAVPATTKRYRGPTYEPRGPALALLPDGRITCLRRGVHPHLKECTKFLVCVPAADDTGEEEFDGFIHDCPPDTIFREHKGRCSPGSCSKP